MKFIDFDLHLFIVYHQDTGDHLAQAGSMRPGRSYIDVELTAQALDLIDQVQLASLQIGNHRVVGGPVDQGNERLLNIGFESLKIGGA